MRAGVALRALGPIDLTSVRRDPLLRWMGLLPLLVALLVRWGVPFVGRAGFPLEAYSDLLGSFLLMMTPMTYGTVIGFLLLDEKDERTLTALQVTPLTPGAYLRYRIGIPCLLSVAITVIALELSGLEVPGLGSELTAALAAAPLAPLYALILAAFARNKVQGFALMKASAALNWPPLIAYFVGPEWQWLFGLCPTYWPAKLYWELASSSGGGEAWLFLIGVSFTGAISWWLLRRFDQAVHR